MEFKEIKEQYEGKKLISIIDLNVEEKYIKDSLNGITGNNYSQINEASLMLFEKNKALVFVSYDCDGYRDGDWNIINLVEILDKGNTTGIKNINETIRNIELFEENEQDGLLIVTSGYVIKMGQDGSDSYYPRNFFDVEECKTVALGKGELVNLNENSQKGKNT